ncbi:MAG: MarR family transcriptional regulator [Cryomorphaceae bacterium]|jgi:DNA-binding MarR family transcriptional regulator|nr:MarR family transcriptional regulator [Cryomorphaceae bacterium]
MYNQKAGEHGITMSIGYILMIVDREGTPSTQLGPRMGMEPTSLSRTLKTMEDKGFVYREFDGVDKRKVLVFLTEEGIRYRKIVKKTILDFNEKIRERLSAKKLAAFLEVLEVMDHLVEEELKFNTLK